MTVSHTLTFHHHISALITKCSRSLYALRTICAHGLYGNILWDICVTCSTLVSQLQFARPAWNIWKPTKETGFKAISYGNLPCSFSTLDELTEDADEQLFFSSSYNPNLVLHNHRLLLQPKNTDYNLRQRTHNFTFPIDVSAVIKQNFVKFVAIHVFTYRLCLLPTAICRGVVVPQCGGAPFRQILLSLNGAPENIVYHRGNTDTATFRQISSGCDCVCYDPPKCSSLSRISLKLLPPAVKFWG